jgi:hypothetical protein
VEEDSTLSGGVRLLSTVFLLVFFLQQKSSVVGCSWLEGTGFWHELYSARGGFEAIYVDVQRPIGFLRFAKTVPAKGSVFSARERLHRDGAADTPPPYTETEL